MKVLVVGFSKTGTKSMHAALKILGYSLYDYEHNFYYLRNDWIKILTKGGTKEDFYRMYKDVDATMDIPAVMFWEEILEAFPDCKLIFMRRKDEEDWIKSWEKQAKSVDENYTMKILSCFSPTAFSIMRYSRVVARCVFGSDSLLWYKCFQGISPSVAKKRYRDHNTSVLTVWLLLYITKYFEWPKTVKRAPKEQTIEFSLRDGWGPLCKFLGKPVPEVDFPHRNRGASLIEEFLRDSPVFHRMKLEMKIVISILIIIVAVAYVCYL